MYDSLSIRGKLLIGWVDGRAVVLQKKSIKRGKHVTLSAGKYETGTKRGKNM